jgi:hypothetical protein
VRGDISVHSETLLITDFVNLKIKLTQSFKYAYRDRMCIFILMTDRTYIILYFYRNEKFRWGGDVRRVAVEASEKAPGPHHIILSPSRRTCSRERHASAGLARSSSQLAIIPILSR